MTEDQIKQVSAYIGNTADDQAEADALLAPFGAFMLYGLSVRHNQAENRES